MMDPKSNTKHRATLASKLLVAATAILIASGFTFADLKTSFDDMSISVAQTTVAAQESEGGDESRAEKIARDVQEFYKKTKDFQSHFEQVYTDVAAGSEKKSHGRVYFKKRGMMRWDYYKAKSDKRHKLIVSDGSQLWVYEYEFKQVFKRCLESSQLPTALSFLMGEGDLLEQFDVSMADGSSDDAPVLEMVPREATSKYKKIHMEIDPETNQVVRTKIFDPYGNTNEIEFDKTKVNQNLPDSGFDFKPPKGARLLNPQKKCK